MEGEGQNPQISWVAGGWEEDGLSSRWRQEAEVGAVQGGKPAGGGRGSIKE